jgi:DNA helicase II / ATP-dependent DNA helicase PcrA
MNLNKRNKLRYKIKIALNCKWSDLSRLSVEQVKYINHYLKHSSFLEACPGSGKTEVIAIKTAYDIFKWKKTNSGIAVVTFTISAAKELNQRIKRFGNVSAELFPHFIGTFDSWMHNYILQPFAHYMTGYAGKNGDKSVRLIDIESSAGFLSNYSTSIFLKGKMLPVKVTEYYFDHAGILHGHNDKIDTLLKSGLSVKEITSLKDKKLAFLKAGFATYADTETLCNGLLNKYPYLQEKLSKRFPVIIVDECQDLSVAQINILEYLRNKGTNLHFVGDLNQSIYEFRKVNPKDIKSYIQTHHFTIKKLTNNYRSCQQIVDVTENIIGNSQTIIGHESTVCQQPCIIWQYDAQTFSQLPQKFEQFLISHGLEEKKSVILARGKTTISPLRTQAEKYSFSKSELFAIAIHDWHKFFRTTEDLNHSLFYLGRVLCLLAYNGQGDVRNQYCPEFTDSVSWRLLLKQILKASDSIYPFEEAGLDLSWTKWIKFLKQFLQSIWTTFPGNPNQWSEVSAKIKSPDGKTNSLVKETCTQVGLQNKFRTTTIHSVKGETLNAVLLVSHHNKQSKGGHFSHWLREGNFDPEHIRFAYVACSRPKYALIIATPQLTGTDLQKLQQLGFQLPS